MTGRPLHPAIARLNRSQKNIVRDGVDRARGCFEYHTKRLKRENSSAEEIEYHEYRADICWRCLRDYEQYRLTCDDKDLNNLLARIERIHRAAANLHFPDSTRL